MRWVKNVGQFFFGMLMATLILSAIALPVGFVFNIVLDKMFPEAPNTSDEFEDYIPGENFPFF